jgi:chemotaxis response regulator CheB
VIAGMPEAALAAGGVDEVVALAEMSRAIERAVGQLTDRSWVSGYK